jgi:hypothetical protein
MSSRLNQPPDSPLDFRVPTTRKGMLLTRMTLPIGSSSSNRFFFSSLPRTQTLAADFSWASSK